MTWLTEPQAWFSLITLTSMEIILGVDNIIVLSMMANRLPPKKRNTARSLGLFFAMITRILLLLSIAWIAHLKTPLFSLGKNAFSLKDLIFIAGGLFLLVKSTHEIHIASFKEEEKELSSSYQTSTMFITLIQIALIDIVFSLDSVITAIGMAKHIEVMIIAIILSVIVMLFAANSIARFIDKYPTIKILALGFLIMIGIMLIADGLQFHIPKGYIYFAIFFSLSIETLNIMKERKKINL